MAVAANVLQWGRARSSAEGAASKHRARLVPVRLQWGRARSSAEGKRGTGARPRRPRFNGAALDRARKVSIARSRSACLISLQWGRARSSAEGVTRADILERQ